MSPEALQNTSIMLKRVSINAGNRGSKRDTGFNQARVHVVQDRREHQVQVTRRVVAYYPTRPRDVVLSNEMRLWLAWAVATMNKYGKRGRCNTPTSLHPSRCLIRQFTAVTSRRLLTTVTHDGNYAVRLFCFFVPFFF